MSFSEVWSYWRHKVCRFRLRRLSLYFLKDYHSLSCVFGDFIPWKILSVVWCWVAAVEKGRALLTRQIVQPDQIERICDVEEWDVTEEDEEDEDDVLFAILESRFGNKETVRNWQTIKLSCLQYKKIGDEPIALASLTWFNHFRMVAVVCKSDKHAANIMLQSNACTSYFKQYLTSLLGGDNLNNLFFPRGLGNESCSLIGS